MSGQQPASVHLRRLVPLIAVLGLLWTRRGLGGGPVPDHPPSARLRRPTRRPLHKRRVPRAGCPIAGCGHTLTAADDQRPHRRLRPVTPAPSPKPRQKPHQSHKPGARSLPLSST